MVEENEKSAEELVEEVKSSPKSEGSFQDKIRKNPWMLSTMVLGVVVVLMLIIMMTGNGGVTGNVISENDAGQKIVDFAEGQGVPAELVEVNDNGNLYEVVLSIQGQESPVYITKDGDYFVQGAVPFETLSNAGSQTQQTPPPTDVVKSDKPKVELFVMTHCPYGTQAEKGFLPAIAALGNKVDASVKFVHYFLHKNPGQEPDETPVQMCIREEQNAKFAPYLACFLEDGDSARCLNEVGVDETKLDDCKENRYEGLYAADSALSEGYGVRGSPTLVINGVQSSAGRSPASYLAGICAAFNEAPSECDEVLSSEGYTPGFGYDAASSAAASSAQCG